MSLTLSPIDQDIQNKNPTKKEARFIISYRNVNLFCPKEPRSQKTKLFSFSFFSVFKSNKSKSKPIMFDFLERQNATQARKGQDKERN